LVSARIFSTSLDEGEGTLYLINLPSLKLGLCENLLHQLMQLDESEGIPPQHVDTVVFVLVKKIT
jgi:hypothetical protein